MKKSKATRRALFSSVISLILCFAMLVGTTFAWFTDTVKTGVNQIVAGNLDIEVYHTSASVANPESIENETDLFRDVNGAPMLWEPGAMSYETFTVKNEGTLALKYKLAMNILDYNAVSSTGNTLKNVLKVKVLTGSEMLADINRTTVSALDWNTAGTLDVFNTSGTLKPSGSAGDDKQEFQVIVYWAPGDNDNNWNVNNDKTTDGLPLFINFGINVVASQLNYEHDTFGPDYDQGIALPDLPVSINKVFQSAPIVGESVTESVTVKNISTDVGVATVQADSVNAVIDALKAQATDKADDSDLSTVIYLDVQTADKTDTSVTYNIDLYATLTYTDTAGASQTTTLASLNGNLADKIVTATMDIGKGLTNVTVKHHDTPMSQLASEAEDAEGYYYNKTFGVLTINSKSFSPFTVAYTIEGVAAIGDTVYGTLEDAVNAASEGDTIVLLRDVTEDAAELSFNVYDLTGKTLDLNGKTYSCNNGAYAFQGTGGTIKNGQMVCLNNGSYALFVGEEGETNHFTVDSITMTGGVNIYNATNVVLKNLNVTGTNYYAVWLDEEAEATIESGTYTAGDIAAVNVFPSSVLTIAGGTIDANDKPLMGSSGGDLVVTGGRFSSDPTDYLSIGVLVSQKDDGYYYAEASNYWKDYAAESYAFQDDTAKIIEIANANQLSKLAVDTNSGITFNGYTVKLTDDIDLSGKLWTPIGVDSNSRFAAVFDGQNHTISNLCAHDENSAYTALIGYANKELKNINFHNVDVYGSASATLVGATNAKVENIHLTGTIKVVGCCYTGGIVCEGYGLIDNCSVIAEEGSGSCVIADGHDASNHWSNSGGIRGFTGEGNVVTKNVTVKNLTITAANGGIGGITGNIHYGNTVENALVENCSISSTKTTSYGRYVGAIGGRTVNGNTIKLKNVKAINTTISTSASSYAQYVASSYLIPYISYSGYAIDNVGVIVDGTSYTDFGAAVAAALAVPEDEDNTIYLYGKLSSSELTQEQAQSLKENNIRIVKSGYSCSVPTLSADTGYQYAILDGSYVYVVATGEAQLSFSYVARNGNKYYTDAGTAISEAVSGDTIYLREATDKARTLAFEQSLTIVSEVEGAVWTGAAADTGLLIRTETTGNATTYSTEVNMETAPAKIGDTYYPTLQAAFTAMTADQTIVLLRDVDLGNSKIQFSKSGALDLNGHKLTTSYGSDGTLYMTGSNTTQFAILDSVGTGEVSNTSTASGNFANAVEVWNNKTTVTISGGTYKTSGSKNYAIYVRGNVTITGGRVEGICYVNGGSLTITGGTFTVDPSAYVPGTHQATQNADGTWTVTALDS